MNKLIMKKSIILIILVSTFSFPTQAQIEYIFAAKEDASTYVEHYLNPAINGLMYDLSNGWYSRAKTHKKFGFDLTIAVSVATIPSDEQCFQFVASDYDNLTIHSGNSELPTITGDETNSVLEIDVSGSPYTINALDGHGDKWLGKFIIPISIPTPMIQVGFGLPLKTDLKIRFFPSTEIEGVAFKLLGFGLKHDLSQYFQKGEKQLFTLSGLAAFTQVNLTYAPDNIDISGSNQALTMYFKNYTVQAIAGLNLRIINFYAGFGYVEGNTDLDVKGTYKFDLDSDNTVDVTVTNPINLDFTVSGFKTTFGARLNLGFIKIFGDYTFQKYPSITAGVAFGLR